jgi:hypothetical protein
MVIVRENIPEARVDAIEEIFRIAGATDIKRLKENDGEFTLIVTLPDRQRHVEPDA